MFAQRHRAALLVSSAFAVFLTFGPAAAADPTFRFDIPAESLSQALTDFSQASSQQIIFSEDLVKGRVSPGLHGTYSAQQALESLLAGTGLKIVTNSAGVLMVKPAGTQAAKNDAAPAPAGDAVETVIVTAEKRAESSLDVPMSLTALSGEDLARSQSRRFEDFVGKVPGLTLIDSEGALGSQLVLRGLTTGELSINSSVAAYIDESPYTTEGPFAASFLSAPNLDTFDMQRIEVLRGPQGTLYGANALGGLLKFVTNAPDPSGYSADVESGVSSVYNGGVGFDAHGMVNIPLADDAALRIVGYDNYYPGFIDDPSRGLKDVNGSHYIGGRASMLYEPTDNFSIRVSALYQVRSWSDSNDEDVNPDTLTPVNGRLDQENLIGQPGSSTNQLYNVTAKWDLGFAHLLSTSSYSAFSVNAITDSSKEYGPLISSIFGAPYGLMFQGDWKAHGFTQELRLASSDDVPLQWQVGGYYTNQDGNEFEAFFPIDATTKTILYGFAPNLGTFELPVRYTEYAAYGDLDYHVTPTFDAAVGGRYSTNNQTFHETGAGLLSGGGADFGTKSSQGVFTYSGDLRWHVTPDDMLYARIAEGFDPGGPNDAIPAASLPSSYSSSTDVNYEAGLKSSLLNDHLTVELSAFHIVWHDLQLTAIVNGFGAVVNGGSAQSNGAEWNVSWVPLDGLTLNVNGAYTDAYLTQATPASVGGLPGDPLPSVPLWETSASAEYEQPLFADYSGFVAGDWRYNGSRDADFEPASSGPRQEMGGFNIFDARIGVETARWSVTLYVKNLANEIGINYVRPETLGGGFGPESASVYTPRSIGLTVSAKF